MEKKIEKMIMVKKLNEETQKSKKIGLNSSNWLNSPLSRAFILFSILCIGTMCFSIFLVSKGKSIEAALFFISTLLIYLIELKLAEFMEKNE